VFGSEMLVPGAHRECRAPPTYRTTLDPPRASGLREMRPLVDDNRVEPPSGPLEAKAPSRRSLADSLRLRRAREAALRPSIDVREVIREEMKKGRSGDYLANCVLSRLGTYQKQGLQPDWASQHPKAMLPVGFHGFGRDADGKRPS